MSSDESFEIDMETGPSTSRAGFGSQKRKYDDEQIQPKKATPGSSFRQSYDYFENLKTAKKRLKFGDPDFKIQDIKIGASSGEILKFRVIWSSGLREGQPGKQDFFSFVAVDDTGRVTCTAFKQDAHRTAALIETGKAYALSGFSVKQNKMGTGLEVYIQEYSKLEEIEDTTVRESIYEFKTVQQLRDLPVGSKADFLGIMAKDWGLRKTRNNILRDVTLVDENHESGAFSFFDELGENFQFHPNSPIAIGCVSITAFENGKSFSIFGTPLMQNPATFGRATDLKRRFDEKVAEIEMEVD